MLSKPFSLTFKVLLLLALAGLAILIWGKESWAIPWEATTYADAEEFGFRSFQKGLFQFGITGEFYTLAETFSAGAIGRILWVEAVLLGVIWLGVCLVCTVITYLRRVWFFVASGLLIFFLISLNLGEPGLFGLSGNLVNVILVSAFILPTYLYQAYPITDKFILRLLTYCALSMVLVFGFSGTSVMLIDQVMTAGFAGFVAMILFFLILISEEIIFAILYLVTNARGGRNNHIHFIAFSLLYIGFIGLYYARKVGFIDWEFTFFNPMLLLIASATIALWSFSYKKVLYESTLVETHIIMLAVGLGLVTAGFLGIAYFNGNDPVFEATSTFTIYMHLAFGMLFFLYVISNFIDPLIEGLQIYKIVYRELNFPYATARIGGFVIIAALFFYSGKQTYFLYRAGHYNYLGQQAETAGQNGLALRYFQESNVYAHDNHYSNYKAGYHALQSGNIKEANLRLGRATFRNPTPQAFVNHAGTYSLLGEVAASQAILEAGLRIFPANSELSNNLGMILYDLGLRDQAEAIITKAGKDPDWSQASEVNKWKIRRDTPEVEEYLDAYAKGNLAVKANVLAQAMRMGQSVEFQSDTTALVGFPLHRQAFLINRVWYDPDAEALVALNEELSRPMEYGVRKIALNAYREAAVFTGQINNVFASLDMDLYQADEEQRAEIVNIKGRLALEHHALALAERYFRQASDYGLAPAKMNLVATLLEAHEFEAAMAEMERFSVDDSTFHQIREDLSPLLLSKSELPLESTFIYYRYDEFSPGELKNELATMPTVVVENLWKKINRELLLSNSLEELQGYQRVFEKHIDSGFFDEMNMILSLQKGSMYTGGIYSGLQSLPDSLLLIELKAIASQNALHEPFVLAVAQRLQQDQPQLAYDLLVEAIDINQTSVALHKAYCLQALSSGYIDYGKVALERLKKLTTPAEYQAFERIFNEKASIESSFSSTW